MPCEEKSQKFPCRDIVSDECVKYTGESSELLGICQGMALSDLEAIIIDRLEKLAIGEGITLAEITGNCPFVQTTLQNSDKSLFSLIQGLYDNQCTLRQFIETVEAGLDPPFAFDLKCLTTPTVISRDTILQAVIDQSCLNKTDIAQIKSELANTGDDDTENTILNAVKDLVGNMVKEMLSSCQGGITSTGVGVNTKISFNAQVPIGTLLDGAYDQSWFASTGLGLSDYGLCGYAIADGRNGTVDCRGFVRAGTLQMGSGNLDPLVNPANGNFIDNSLLANYLTKAGRNKGVLSASQLPDHRHLTLEVPHEHQYTDMVLNAGTGNAFPSPDGLDKGGSVQASNVTRATTKVSTNLEVLGINGTFGQSIDFRQPTKYVRVIQRIR